MSRPSSYSSATHFKDWDEKSAGVKVNWLRQNLQRMVAVWLRRGDCVLSSKCFSLNASLCHQLAAHPCTPRRCSRQIHCSSIHRMDFYLPFYLARDFRREGGIVLLFLSLHGGERKELHPLLIISRRDCWVNLCSLLSVLAEGCPHQNKCRCIILL